MGITKLADLIRSDAPGAISHKEISDYTGKVIALDTSIVMNQFRTAVPSMQHLSPLTGLFFRTLTFLEHDIKPVYVIDGRPPEEKKAVLERRAKNAGWNSPPHPRRNAVSSQTQDCLQLLRLVGVPVVMAPGDAEACCAHLVKTGMVHAVASEDMDTLPFGGSVLLRQLNAKKDSDVTEYCLSKILEILQLSHKEFVDLCILLGCDYCEKIGGLGPKRALSLIKQHRTIECVAQNVNKKTHPVPVGWKYQGARDLFLESLEVETPELVWSEPDEEGLVRFLCQEKHASGGRVMKEHRVRSRMEKFRQSLQDKRSAREEAKASGHQSRMEDFFRVTRKRQSQEAVCHGKGKHPKKTK
ncbi:probable flap endonuclease 1 homolog [Clupea harengus]|uniref:Probable flap endonuclease 1 homolog n=1 Tax=Clupea harengus TaxID=7950 RepID=A0A6P8ETQ4_CLUHA|nr:probable flap endonuclease 1 homolog [Clupea harengus]